ncbi:hypothetical protein TsFJ059_001116 [Trichoderma semiorbis]|uniref:HNH nuclease domain-containing protein n=1 Tax=Trichoderma semiorbis TaxID=1491008 RepID=A0A9P8HW83_9HYPO|nr:hypothetical protein TsFJ059_001116 [Trichoderma semiorbis]
MDFKDPFDGYQLTKHPSSASSDPLSSAPNSPLQWRDLQPDVERILRGYKPLRQKDDTADVLRAFLKYLCKDAQTTLMREIKQFGDKPAELRQLRNFLVDSILKPMMMAGGKQPKSLTPSPVREVAFGIQLSMTQIEPSSRSDQSILKKRCLRRDNNRCILTGMVDRAYFKSLPPQRRGDLIVCTTECAHIIPFALRKFDPNSAQETEVKAQIWVALERYFPFIKGKIGPESINTPANAVTLRSDIHVQFGAFDISTETTAVAHKYSIYKSEPRDYVNRDIPPFVTLTQSDPAVEMPDPDFLRLHYQVSMILKAGVNLKLVFMDS